MNESKKIVKNYVYNLIYQMLLIFLPLITLPYLSRILGAEGIGIYSYVVAVVSYFILIGSLGLNLYGQKEIAYVQNDKEKRSKLFEEIFLLKCTLLMIALMVFICIFTIQGEYKEYYRILIIEIVGNVLDITWFFQGMEEFKKSVARNSIVKIISTLLIFVLIRKKSDLYLYFYIYAISICAGNLTLWIFLKKYINWSKVQVKNCINHIKPAIILFIPQVATQIYTVLDKSMLGNLATSIEEVGYYDNAQKIIKVGITLVTAMGTVMLPRISNFFANGKKAEITKYITKSFNLVFFISFPVIFGLIATVDDFVPIFFGEGFGKVADLIKYICPIILIIGMTNILGIQYLLPIKNNKPYVMAVVCGATINILLNFSLIPVMNSVGASIATIVAEFSVFFVEYLFLRKDFEFKKILKNACKYFIAAFLMFIVCMILDYFINIKPILKILVQVLSGSIIYFLVLIIFKDEFVKIGITKMKSCISKGEYV